MAKLIKCKSCNAEVSKNAKACPQCGEPLKRKPIGCVGAIVIILLVAVVGVAIQDQGGGPSEPKKPLTAEQVRAKKIMGQFGGSPAQHMMLARSVKKSLKDPKSFEVIETTFDDKGDFILVRMHFRAKNSFGGYTDSVAEGKYGIDGKVIGQPKILE